MKNDPDATVKSIKMEKMDVEDIVKKERKDEEFEDNDIVKEEELYEEQFISVKTEPEIDRPNSNQIMSEISISKQVS